jgi:hypothetical protein
MYVLTFSNDSGVCGSMQLYPSSSIDLESSSDYLPGGTLMSAIGSGSSRVAHKEIDPMGMGQWSSLNFVGKQNTKVTVITR